MPSAFRATVVIPMYSGLPSDVVTNSFCFISDDIIGKELVAAYLTGRLEDFYQDVYGSNRMADYMKPTDAHVVWYDLGDPTPRVPFADVPMEAATGTTSSILPTEAAAVLSFHGQFVSGEPNARRRGRIFLGGLAAGCVLTSSSTRYPQLNPTWIGQITTAAETHLLDTGDSGLFWGVYSETNNLAYGEPTS